MDISKFLLCFADYIIDLPAAFLCILPVLAHSRVGKKRLFLIVPAVTILTAIPMALIVQSTGIDPNIPLGCLLVPFFVVYMILFDVKKSKLLYLFITAIAVFSFGGLATHFVNAMTDQKSDTVISVGVKWLISLLFLTAEIVFLKKLRWLFDNENIDSIWRFVWIVPLIITAANFMMIPADYSNVHIGRIFELYIWEEILLVTFFIIFLVMQYNIARAITNKTEAEHDLHILGFQAAQYENLKNYMDSTSKLRHDFVYMAKTAQKLAADGEIKELQKLLSDYGADIDANTASIHYCDHPALNAITAYYAAEAKGAGIRFTAKLNVSQNVVISDYELCSVVGNILDNALAAAKEVNDESSKILFAADTKANGDLYIVISNPYSGAVRKNNNSFASTKKGGHGIGLESVKAIVSKNNGYCNFRFDSKVFYSEIMLRQD